MRKPRRAEVAVALILSAACSVLAFFGPPPTYAFSVSDLESYDRLTRAEYFAGPAVGIGGEEPAESKALRSLAAHASGSKAFKYLLFSATPAGRLYALVGLRHTDPAFFWIAVQPFRFLPGEVETIFGCVGQRVAARELVATPEPNPVRLERGETLRQWWERRKPGDEFSLDILGGGYTSMFVDLDELRRPRPQLRAGARR